MAVGRKLLQTHVCNLYMAYNPRNEGALRKYLSALFELFSNGSIEKLVINNVEDFMASLLESCTSVNYVQNCEDNQWYRILWEIIDEVPVILSADETDENRRRILDLFTTMPDVAVACQDKCAPHMRRYMQSHPVDVSSGGALARWIENFKVDTKN